MPRIETRDRTSLYFKQWGSGRPVILIHGWPLSADSWDDIALPLAEAGYRAIAYDRRGFGRSDQPWEGYNYDTFSDDLADVIAHTGASDATLVGFSMGGGEVARYMSRHQGKGVVQTALISSIVPYVLKTPDNPAGAEPAAIQQIKDGIRKDRAKFFGSFFKLFFGVGLITSPVSDELVHWAWTVAMQASLKATLDCVTAFSSTDFRRELSAFTRPTLIVHGTADQNVPIDCTSRAAARGITGSKLIEYPGQPHGVFATHKDELIADLLSFLRG